VARMLEAIRKDYWNAPEEVKIELAKKLQKLQKEYGFTCCHHTCGNLDLLNYAAGILSSIEQRESKEGEGGLPREDGGKKAPMIGSGGRSGRLIQAQKTAGEETNQSVGFGFGFEQTAVSSHTGAEEVSGYRMETSEQQQLRIEVSTTPLVALLIVIVAVLVFYAGMRMRK